jgi:hypothetical protein
VADDQGGRPPRYEFSHALLRTWSKRPPRDPARVERISAKLIELWKLEPDQRMGQLVVNVMRREGRRLELPDVQLLEDDDFERLLDAELEAARARHSTDWQPSDRPGRT